MDANRYRQVEQAPVGGIGRDAHRTVCAAPAGRCRSAHAGYRGNMRRFQNIGALMLCACLFACSGASREDAGPYLVEVTALDHAFSAPDEVPAGWLTFKLNNEMAHEIHEISLARLPEGIDHQTYVAEYTNAWQTLLDEYRDGIIQRQEVGARTAELLPEWGGDIVFITSRGLLSPGRIASNSLYLEPGVYSMDCWVKSADGQIHISEGMSRALTVTDNTHESAKPHSGAVITLSENTIDTDWEPAPGKHAFEVRLTFGLDGRPHNNNIHLIRLDEQTDLAEVNLWLDWYEPNGLMAPAPADFLGGLNTYDADPESRFWFSLEIDEPGMYAWVVWGPGQELLAKEFEVPPYEDEPVTACGYAREYNNKLKTPAKEMLTAVEQSHMSMRKT